MFLELKQLLNRRLEIIADHEWRDHDPSAQLAALGEISQRILDWTASHRSQIDARLRHYLDNSSLQKALDHLEALSDKHPSL
jgi:hypothetical protein